MSFNWQDFIDKDRRCVVSDQDVLDAYKAIEAARERTLLMRRFSPGEARQQPSPAAQPTARFISADFGLGKDASGSWVSGIELSLPMGDR